MTFYDILGVSPDASQKEIRTAYRRLARLYHPDNQLDADPETREAAEENIKAINAAFHALSDPLRRRDYHRVMWSRVDPAQKYQYRPLHGESPQNAPRPQEREPADPGRPPRTTTSSSIYLEILQAREEREQTIQRHHRKRSRLWMSAGFTSLLVYFLMVFGLQLYPFPADLLPLILYFAGAELITLSIILVASGMRFGDHPLGEPAALSLMMFLGTLVTCSSAVRAQMLLQPPSGLYFGLIISTALVLHLVLSTRLGRLQEVMFHAEIRELDEHLKDLEAKLHQSKKNKN